MISNNLQPPKSQDSLPNPKYTLTLITVNLPQQLSHLTLNVATKLKDYLNLNICKSSRSRCYPNDLKCKMRAVVKMKKTNILRPQPYKRLYKVSKNNSQSRKLVICRKNLQSTKPKTTSCPNSLSNSNLGLIIELNF